MKTKRLESNAITRERSANSFFLLLQIKIKDAEVELRALSEDEEKIYLAKAVEAMKNRRQLNQKNRKRRSGGHHDRNEEKKQKKSNE